MSEYNKPETLGELIYTIEEMQKMQEVINKYYTSKEAQIPTAWVLPYLVELQTLKSSK